MLANCQAGYFPGVCLQATIFGKYYNIGVITPLIGRLVYDSQISRQHSSSKEQILLIHISLRGPIKSLVHVQLNHYLIA
jgi:hypothetical protein